MADAKGEGIYNAVVIGAGTGGLVTAAGTAALGGRVALIERADMGGECLNTGCVPSKALISSARLIDRLRHAQSWGLSAEEPRFEFAKIFERMRQRRSRIAPHDSQERFEGLGVDVFRGQARFLSPYEVEVGDAVLRAANFVIATGSRPRIPEIEGLSSAPFLTNETVFDELSDKPLRMVVLGGGPVGCELAQVFARLKVSVTLMQREHQLLVKEDADASELVRRCLETDGVRVLTGAEVKIVTRHGARTRVWVEVEGKEREPIDADVIFVATGRVPNVEALDLPAAGVAATENGVTVDEFLRTAQRHIFAAGDVTGSHRFTHVADHHARTVIRNILLPRFPTKVDLRVLPRCTFTSPEVARVGVNENEARERGLSYDVYRESMEAIDRAVVEEEETGFAKVLVEKGTDRILGATIVSSRAGELIHEFALAMKAGAGLKTISSLIHAYPTESEITRRLADQQQRRRLTPRVARFFSWLYRRSRRKAGRLQSSL